jgi:hypothetical protein
VMTFALVRTNIRAHPRVGHLDDREGKKDLEEDQDEDDREARFRQGDDTSQGGDAISAGRRPEDEAALGRQPADCKGLWRCSRAGLRYLDIREGELDEAQLAEWVKQASKLPGERL